MDKHIEAYVSEIKITGWDLPPTDEATEQAVKDQLERLGFVPMFSKDGEGDRVIHIAPLAECRGACVPDGYSFRVTPYGDFNADDWRVRTPLPAGMLSRIDSLIEELVSIRSQLGGE